FGIDGSDREEMLDMAGHKREGHRRGERLFLSFSPPGN
ncbi:unnamed protein product, partial [marine sediment metagenome]